MAIAFSGQFCPFPSPNGIQRSRPASTTNACLRDAARAGVVASALSAFVALSVPTFVHAEGINVERCEGGVGKGCDQLAEGNEFIRNLQRKSNEVKEKRDRQMLEDYWKRGYGDYFQYDGEELVKNDDGTWSLRDSTQRKFIRGLFGGKDRQSRK